MFNFNMTYIGTTDGESTAELLALMDCRSDIQDLCVNCAHLTMFATKLEGKKFLDSSAVSAALDRQGTTKMDSVRHLMDAVVAQIKVDRKKFEDFLDILRSITSLETLAETLKERCGKYFLSHNLIAVCYNHYYVRLTQEKAVNTSRS